VPAPTYATAGWYFRRALGLTYLFAFWSMALQIDGLVGQDGILPAAGFLDEIGASADASGIGMDRYRLVPTLVWLAPGDRILHLLTLGGMVLSLALILGVASAGVLPLLWLAYLSLSSVAGEWMSYQWDALLLETGFLACFMAPWRWRDRLRDTADPAPAIRWMMWWLLFRLMFGSGLVKLASGDPTWRDLTALSVHFETQPLPTPIAWYAAQLPLLFDRLSTAAVLAIELALPWFIVLRARARRLAAVGMVVLQLLIAATGNYAFFNLLTIALCLMLIDDVAFAPTARWRHTLASALPAFRGGRVSLPACATPTHAPAAQRRAALVAALVLIPISVAVFGRQFQLHVPVASSLEEFVRPFGSVNRYGLFAVMTTTRPEIVIEGSADGVTWREYEFRHKPGRTTRSPSWVAPFQPRLDWQMWFAALGRYEEELWFQRFVRRLLEGSPPVLALLETNPFPSAPPRFVRATLYRYRFSARGDTGWWVRERVRDYHPAIALDEGR
jgi:lipase maturation factor 1